MQAQPFIKQAFKGYLMASETLFRLGIGIASLNMLSTFTSPHTFTMIIYNIMSIGIILSFIGYTIHPFTKLVKRQNKWNKKP